MLSVDRTQTKKQTFAFIIACLLNFSFLFFIFLCELQQNVMFNEQISYEQDIVLDLLQEQPEPIHEKSDNSDNSYKNDAGLMMRGTPDGTVPPTLFSGYAQSTKIDSTHENEETELIEQTIEKITSDGEKKAQNKTVQEKSFNEEQSVFVSTDALSGTPLSTISKKTMPHPSTRKKRQTSNGKPSLAQMTRTALETVQAKGNAAIFMSGDPNKLPSELQLIEEHYWAKMEKVWHNSFTLLKDQLMDAPQRTMIAIVELLYLPDGHIKHVHIIRSSGSGKVDRFILAVFADALPSFPPKPSRLRSPGDNKRQCTVHLRIT